MLLKPSMSYHVFDFVLADALRFDSAGYDSADTGSANAQCIVRVHSNGTWDILGGLGDSITGSPTSGFWANVAPGQTFNGAFFELQYVTSNLVNSPTITNGASSYTAITPTFIDISIATSSGTLVRSADVTVNIRGLGNTSPILTQTFNCSAQGSGGGGVGGVGGVGVIIP